MKNSVIDFTAAKEKFTAPTPEQSALQEKRKEAISKLPRYRGEVPSKNVIRGLPNVVPGEIFWVTGDNKAYIVAEKDHKKMTIKALDETATVSTGMTIFDMNKAIISKEPLFDFEDGEAHDALIDRFMQFFLKDCNDEFYLLYGRDIHYLSLFRDVHKDERGRSTMQVLFEALKNVGDLISVDFNNSDGEVSAEIWVRTADSKAELLYLFPYDKGVIPL